MNKRELTVDEIRAFGFAREVDIVFASGSDGSDFRLAGGFDDYADYFSVQIEDVEYVDIIGRFTLGDVRLVSDANEILQTRAKWRGLIGLVSGVAVAFRSADAASWASAKDSEVHLVVANAVRLAAGVDWDAEVFRLGLAKSE